MHPTLRFLILFSVLILHAGVARADTAGAIGPVAGLQVNTTSADTYLQFHGRVFVKNPNGALDEYRWGGASCGSKTLTEAQVGALRSALEDKRIVIEPLHLPGQGMIICLVGFTVAPKSSVKLVFP